MRDEKSCRRVREPEILNEKPQPPRGQLVECAERFIEQQETGLDGEGPRSGDALALAA